MATLIRLTRSAGPRPHPAGARPRPAGAKHDIFFDRHEFGQILSAYSMGVIQGAWRDYAIDRGRSTAIFSIFRSSREHPLYRFVKTRKSAQADPVFTLFQGPRKLTSSSSLGIVLDRFHALPGMPRGLRLVKG